MSRKTAEITITAEGRDKGKRFEITEMSASTSEAWAIRALAAASKSGIDIPAALLNGGLAGFAVLGMQAFMQAPYSETKPLLDEMFQCIRYVPALMGGAPVPPRALVEDDIEEVPTRMRLREEVMQLHLGFFKDAVQLIRTVVMKMLASPELITPISPDASGQSSPAS